MSSDKKNQDSDLFRQAMADVTPLPDSDRIEPVPSRPPAAGGATKESKEITCYHCGEKGHKVQQCPKATKEQIAKIWEDKNAEWAKGSNHTQVGIVLKADDVDVGVSMLTAEQASWSTLHPDRMYLDSCSTYISFFNKKLLKNIKETSTCLYGHTNAGISKTNKVGYYGDIECWLDESGIANIFSIPVLKRLGFHIVYDSDNDFWEVTEKRGRTYYQVSRRQPRPSIHPSKRKGSDVCPNREGKL